MSLSRRRVVVKWGLLNKTHLAGSHPQSFRFRELGGSLRICFTKSSQVMPNAADLGTKNTLRAIDIELLSVNTWQCFLFFKVKLR